MNQELLVDSYFLNSGGSIGLAFRVRHQSELPEFGSSGVLPFAKRINKMGSARLALIQYLLRR
jgi:hypothetical protein